MVGVGENEEHVLEKTEVVCTTVTTSAAAVSSERKGRLTGLEEAVRHRRSSSDNVVDELDANAEEDGSASLENSECHNALKSQISDIPHRVLRRPNDAVHDELELWCRDLKQGVKAVDVDRADEAEEGEALDEQTSVVWSGEKRRRSNSHAQGTRQSPC